MTVFAFGEVPSKDLKFVEEVFPAASKFIVHKVVDSISDNPINVEIVKVLDSKKKTLGFYRKLITSTGCNSACLPITATLFYNKDKSYKEVKSKKGLTKKNHVPFSSQDYQELELILNINPEKFKVVKHPKDMVDVITGETTKAFEGSVVKEAAYTSLRINTYNQDTLKKLKEL